MRARAPPLKPYPLSPFDDDAAEGGGAARPGARKKGVGVRPWLLVDASGQTQVVEAGKHAIMKRTGLPARDLRILDPLLSYPSTVLGRERAIVINLEHIKAIITAHEVLLLNSKENLVLNFIEELQRSLVRFQSVAKQQEGGMGDGNANWGSMYDSTEAQSATLNPDFNYPREFSMFHETNDIGKPAEQPGLESGVGPRVLPFEFIALEACLESACGCLEKEARKLENDAHPALDKLTSKISTLNLERVRQIKSQLVAITGRVQKVRDELEHLLDDDEDMAEMYLTDKLFQQRLDGSDSLASLNERRESVDNGVVTSDVEDGRIAVEMEAHDVSNNDEGDLQNDDNQESVYAVSRLLSSGHGTRTSSTRSGSKHLDVEELEMLLEAYFVQIDGILNNLSALREYVDDTEDYINIMLDDKQNHLLQMGVMLTTATLVVSAFVVVVGVFGMNIKIELFTSEKAGMPEFLWTVGGGATGSIFLYIAAITWCKHKRLLE
ncbi:hypothetical protein AMTRI_Chr12g239020 [Amborella trichopoda]